MMNYQEEKLKQVMDKLGVKELYAEQTVVMPAVLAGDDILCVAPTASGKSLLFQIPAAYEQEEKLGLTIVVSPLRALQQNQIESLHDCNIDAVLLNSDLSSTERKSVLNRLNQLPILYVTPEQLVKSDLREALRTVTVKRVVVDEAHIIPQAAPEFRPAFGKIGAFIRKMDYHVQIMALTATATAKETDYIVKSLAMCNPKRFTFPVRRENLHLFVKRITPVEGQEPKSDRLKESMMQAVTDELDDWNGKGRAIVYVPFKKQAKAIFKWLKAHGFKVGLYTGDCSAAERRKMMKRFKNGKNRIMVATSAFGLGIDIPNVRLVIHAGLPFSMDEYVQQCGRAGRDGKKARCVLFFSNKDFSQNRRFLEACNEDPYCRRDALIRLNALRDVTKCNKCLWKVIERYFGDKNNDRCGICSVCLMKKAMKKARKKAKKDTEKRDEAGTFLSSSCYHGDYTPSFSRFQVPPASNFMKGAL